MEAAVRLRRPRRVRARHLASGHQQLATLQEYVKPSQDAVAKLMADTDPTGAAADLRVAARLGPGLSRLVPWVRLPSPGVAPALPGYLPDLSGVGVRVGGVRGGGAEVSRAEVVIADQLELALVRLVRTHAAIAGRLTDGLTWPHAVLVFWLARLRVGDVFISGPRMRVMPCRVLAHDFPPPPTACSADSDYLPGPTAP